MHLPPSVSGAADLADPVPPRTHLRHRGSEERDQRTPTDERQPTHHPASPSKRCDLRPRHGLTNRGPDRAHHRTVLSRPTTRGRCRPGAPQSESPQHVADSAPLPPLPPLTPASATTTRLSSSTSADLPAGNLGEPALADQFRQGSQRRERPSSLHLDTRASTASAAARRGPRSARAGRACLLGGPRGEGRLRGGQWTRPQWGRLLPRSEGRDDVWAAQGEMPNHPARVPAAASRFGPTTAPTVVAVSTPAMARRADAPGSDEPETWGTKPGAPTSDDLVAATTNLPGVSSQQADNQL